MFRGGARRVKALDLKGPGECKFRGRRRLHRKESKEAGRAMIAEA